MRPRQHYRILQAAFVFALVGVAFWASYVGYRSSEYLTYAQAQQHAQGVDYLSTIWHWLAHDAAGFFTAALCIITGILAWVTYGLFVATATLARDTREASAEALIASTAATNLARKEFLATHRPELAVREVTWEMVDMDGGELPNDMAITFSVVNRGRSPCTIVESVAGLRSNAPDGRALPTAKGNLLGRIALAPGEFHHFKYAIETEIEGFVVGGRRMLDCYFRGTIIYEDEAHIRRCHVFARVCSRGADRFTATDNPEDEYTD